MKFADLFCGIGGCALGAAQAGWEPLLLADFDVSLKKCLTPELQDFFFEVDLSAPSEDFKSSIVDAQALLCSPPCQSYSRMKHRNTYPKITAKDKAFADTIIEAARLSQCRFVLIENVPEFLKTSVSTSLCMELEALGFVVDVRVLDAANFGVPQRRKRGFIFATERPINFDQSFEKSTVREAFSSLPPLGYKDPLHVSARKHSELVLQRIKAIPKDGGSRHSLPEHLQLPFHKKTGGYNDVYGRMYWDKVGPTMTTGCVNPSKGRFIHPEEDRVITLREAARLQTFPENMTLGGANSIERSSRLLGNAAPPLMIRRLVELLS